MIILALLILFVMVFPDAVPFKPQTCPKGYVLSPVESTWAGWTFNCVPEGLGDARISTDTLTQPMVAIYAPIIEGTGPKPSIGTPAKGLEFIEQRRMFA